MLRILVLLALSVPVIVPASSFDSGWRFLRADISGAAEIQFDDHTWEIVTLPHTARVEALVAGKDAPQWQGLCWYRKSFTVPAAASNQVAILRFEGAMNAAEVWVNGQSAGKFMGGYLPYVMDVSSLLQPGATNIVALRLDNRDNPITGPKPLGDLDFNLYGGLYRSASLTFKDTLHITDPILANEPAGGGVFVTFPAVSKEAATLRVQTHLRNAGQKSRAFVLRTALLDTEGRSVATLNTTPAPLAAGAAQSFTQELQVPQPRLWSTASPYLYRIRSEVVADGRTVDEEQTRIGIRRIEITRDGFRLNGEKQFLRGANRHQEYPYLGNALSDAAQYRDARKIKEAGFDYIRLSHYPQSPAFLDACDELGLVVMNCLMGWQYFGKDPAFAELKYQECRQLIRRDRNHPSVILWEVSLNESDMPKPFIARTHGIAHEEYPGDQMFTCGWMRGYDVFIQARQHGGCTKVKDVPCVVSEYGDWEYFAQNAGLQQHLWKEMQPAERSSRQLRSDGEARLLQQALNFQEAHNDNLKTRAFADGIWVMFDYNRGYAPEIEASGVMDIFRLPKPGYWFFRSQRDATELTSGQPSGPVLFIANQNTPASPKEIRVFSNCNEVELFRNDQSLGRQRPDQNRIATHLRHPPFTFHVDDYAPGTLRAVGYLGGRVMTEHVVHTPGEPATLALSFDLAGKPFAASGKDAVFCRTELRDARGTVIPTNGVRISLGETGAARLLGQNPIATEAGIATVLLESDIANPATAVFALGIVDVRGEIRALTAAASPDGTPAPAFTVHYTTDGSEPTPASTVYRQPILKRSQLRVALVVGGTVVARVDAPTPNLEKVTASTKPAGFP
jgi:beta-galactosidase